MVQMQWDAPALQVDRGRLVRLCGRLTRDWDAAEDLAQETLAEAWRGAYRLRDAGERWPWLAGIARNVCLRWARARGRELARSSRPADPAWSSISDEGPADAIDLEVELERAELAELVDRALALLPAETRTVLVERYVRESPLTEIAGRLGLSEGAVAMRLQRGKLALRRVLSTDFASELSAYELIVPLGTAEWQFTPIYCTCCGRNRLLGRFERGNTVVRYRCSSEQCPAGKSFGNGWFYTPISGVAAYRRAMTRLLREAGARYRRGLPTRTLECMWCRRQLPLHVAESPPWCPRAHRLRPRSTRSASRAGACTTTASPGSPGASRRPSVSAERTRG